MVYLNLNWCTIFVAEGGFFVGQEPILGVGVGV
jgi:hypothetical protein